MQWSHYIIILRTWIQWLLRVDKKLVSNPLLLFLLMSPVSWGTHGRFRGHLALVRVSLACKAAILAILCPCVPLLSSSPLLSNLSLFLPYHQYVYQKLQQVYPSHSAIFCHTTVGKLAGIGHGGERVLIFFVFLIVALGLWCLCGLILVWIIIAKIFVKCLHSCKMILLELTFLARWRWTLYCPWLLYYYKHVRTCMYRYQCPWQTKKWKGYCLC